MLLVNTKQLRPLFERKLLMRIIGLLLIIFGVADFALSWIGIDVWYDWFGISLPSWLYFFSAFIEVAIGTALMKSGKEEVDE